MQYFITLTGLNQKTSNFLPMKRMLPYTLADSIDGYAAAVDGANNHDDTVFATNADANDNADGATATALAPTDATALASTDVTANADAKEFAAIVDLVPYPVLLGFQWKTKHPYGYSLHFEWAALSSFCYCS